MAIIDREHCVCLWYFSFSFFAWAVDVAHVTGLVSGFECWQIQMDGGRVFFYVFLFVFVDFFSLVRGQWTWLMSLVSSVGKYAEWSLGIDES